MNTYEIDLGPFGKGYADTSYQNNIFQVGWGERVNSKVVYHSYNLLNISFEGNWHCSYFRLDNGTDTFSNAIYCNNGTESNLQLLPISLHFFCFYLKNVPSRIRILNADTDPGGKMNADPCRSGSTALLNGIIKFIIF